MLMLTFFAPPLSRGREGPPSPLAALIIIILLLVQPCWAIFRMLPVLGHLWDLVHKSEMATATQKTIISPKYCTGTL